MGIHRQRLVVLSRSRWNISSHLQFHPPTVTLRKWRFWKLNCFQFVWRNSFEHSQFWRCWRKTLLSHRLNSEKVNNEPLGSFEPLGSKLNSRLGLVFQCQLDMFSLDLLEGMMKFAEFVPYCGPSIALANIYGTSCMKHYARPRNANV